MKENNPILWIQEEYFNRKATNPSYSLRSYATLLGISSGRLSELMSGKRKITSKMAVKMAEALSMDPRSEELFRESVLNNRKSDFKRSRVYQQLNQDKDCNYQQLDLDIFELISRQQYYAILNLIALKENNHSPYWIGSRLNIPEPTVVKAIELLEKLELIKKKDGKLTRTPKKLKTTQDIESRAIKNAHREKLQHSMVSLETIPVELRDITSITCRLEKSKLPEIKELIKEFRRSLSQFMETENSDEVYNLNIQLVPLTRVINNEYESGYIQ